MTDNELLKVITELRNKEVNPDFVLEYPKEYFIAVVYYIHNNYPASEFLERIRKSAVTKKRLYNYALFYKKIH